MKTNDVILFGLGLVAGYFFKSNWDRINSVMTVPTEENFVFSQKYKDCQAEVSRFMSMAKFAQNTDLEAYKKNAVDFCMKKA
jgi:hypothetical protein